MKIINWSFRNDDVVYPRRSYYINEKCVKTGYNYAKFVDTFNETILFQWKTIGLIVLLNYRFIRFIMNTAINMRAIILNLLFFYSILLYSEVFNVYKGGYLSIIIC